MNFTHHLNFKPKSFFFSLNFTLSNSIFLQNIQKQRNFRIQLWKGNKTIKLGTQKCDSSNIYISLFQNSYYFTTQLNFNINNFDQQRDIKVDIFLYENHCFKDSLIGETTITTSRYIRQFLIGNIKRFQQKRNFGNEIMTKIIIFVDSSKQNLVKSVDSYEKNQDFLFSDLPLSEFRKNKFQAEQTPIKKMNYNKQFLINFHSDSLKTITQQQSCFQTQLRLRSQQSSEQIKDSLQQRSKKCQLNRALTMLKIFDQQFGQDFKQHLSESNHSIDSMFQIQMQKEKIQQEVKLKKKSIQDEFRNEIESNANNFSKQTSQVQTKPETVFAQDDKNQDQEINSESSILNVSQSWLQIPEPEKETYKIKYCIFFLLIILMAALIVNLEPVGYSLLSNYKNGKKKGKITSKKGEKLKKSFKNKKQKIKN